MMRWFNIQPREAAKPKVCESRDDVGEGHGLQTKAVQVGPAPTQPRKDPSLSMVHLQLIVVHVSGQVFNPKQKV